MCRWGCAATNTTFMCKWCGTWFCRDCMRGAYHGMSRESLQCRVCNQKKCQGTKVDVLLRQPNAEDENNGKNKRGKSASSVRGKSPSPSKSPKGGEKSGAKKSGGKKGGKKSGKKKKKKK